MQPWKTAVNAAAFALPLKQLIPYLSEQDVTGVQLDARNQVRPGDFSETGIRQLSHLLQERNLSVSALNFPLTRRLTEPQRLDARMAAIREAMQFAPRLRTNTLTLRIGRVPEDLEQDDALAMVDVLDDLTAFGNRVGTALAITPSRDRSPALAALIQAVTAGPLGIDFDPAAFLLAGQDPAQAFSDLHGSVLHLRARDAVEDMDGNGLEVPLGRGQVDWPEILNLLREAGYQRWVTADRTLGDDRAGDVLRAMRYLERVAQE